MSSYRGDVIPAPILSRPMRTPGFPRLLILCLQTLDSSDGTPTTGRTASTRVGRPSSTLHLWDAETMSLLGTLLLPCLALTRDLANAAATFSVHAPRAGTGVPPVDPTGPSCPPPEETDRHCGGSVDVGNGSTPKADSPSPPPNVPNDGAPRQQHHQPAAGAVKAGTGLGRPVLVTALEFLSPYPLVMATLTGGAVVVWRTSDCVCAQVRSNCGRGFLNTNDEPDCSPNSRIRASSLCQAATKISLE